MKYVKMSHASHVSKKHVSTPRRASLVSKEDQLRGIAERLHLENMTIHIIPDEKDEKVEYTWGDITGKISRKVRVNYCTTMDCWLESFV